MTWADWRRRVDKVRAQRSPGRFLLSRVLWHAGVSRLLTIRLPGGGRIRFYPSSISATLWVEPDARSEDAELLRLVLRPGDSYVDCGANVGHLAVMARAITGATGSVVAIEPNPRIFEYCVGNLRLNHFDDVRALNLALGSERGTAHIADRRDDDQNRLGEGGIAVPMEPLDGIVGAEPITLLKIDVEGFELPVLRGAQRALAQTKLVACELSPSNCERFGYRPTDVEDLLLACGFVFARRRAERWTIARHRLYERLAADELPSTGYNLIAVRPEFIPELARRLQARGASLDESE